MNKKISTTLAFIIIGIFSSALICGTVLGPKILLKEDTSGTDHSDKFPPKYDQSFCNQMIDKSAAQNFSGDEYLTEVTSGYCPLQIGLNTTLLISFENISVSSTSPSFILNIYDSHHALLQTLPVAYSSLIDSETVNLHDDINFDGYKDLLLRTDGPRASMFIFYMFNPASKLFEIDKALSHIFLPTFDPKAKTITSTADIPNWYVDDNGDQQLYGPEDQTTVFDFKGGDYVQRKR